MSESKKGSPIPAQQSPAVAVPDDLKEQLQAIINLIDRPHCEGLDRPTEFAISQSRGMRTGSVRSAISKIIKSLDATSPRITEQDARAFFESIFSDSDTDFEVWMGELGGRALLAKLNGGQ